MRGNGSLYKRGPVWWMKFSREGRPFSMSCHTTNKTEAAAMLRAELEKSRGAQWLDPQQRKVTVGELVTDLQQWYRTHGKAETLECATMSWDNHLKAHFDHVRADTLTTKYLRDYRELRLKEGVCNTTINREFAVLRRAYKIAMRAEPAKVTRVPHFELTPENNARKVFIDSAVQQKLMAAAAQRGLWQRAFLEIAFTYGWRVGEIVSIRVRDVDIVDGAIRLERTKNGEAREVPLTPSLHTLLRALVTDLSADSRIFPPRDVRYEFAKICALAGVPCGKKNGGIVLHDIRRSSARNKRAAGVDTSLIMKMHGWKTEAMFRRYALIDSSDMLAALQQEADWKKSRQSQTATVPLHADANLLN